MSELLWRALPAVRRGERDRFLFFFWLAALLSAAATVGLTGSEALFLSGLGPEHLPAALIAASLATLVGSILYAGVVGRARNDRLFVWLLSGTAISLIVDWLLLDQARTAVLPVLFTTFYISQAVFVSLHYWTFATDYFDALSSKRLFPLFAVGASLGGVLGGALAVAVSRIFSAEAVLLAWVALLGLAALHVRLARGRLLGWAPVGAIEADESSVEGLRGAARYLRRSRMATWLVVSIVGMVFSLTVMQYLYLDLFSDAFPTSEQLATFFGAYLAITNGIEILVGNALTPWLIRRFGVAGANLAHPILTIVTFIALAVDPRLWAAVVARANRELLENALAGPVRALSYNALPHRFRGRMRALLEGVVFFAAMSIAGAALLALGESATPVWLALLGGASALLYASANWIVRREYLKSLVAELRQGSLDLDAVADTLGARELAELAEPWERTLAEAPEQVTTALLELAGPLAARGFTEVVTRQARHGDPGVGAAALQALLDADPTDCEQLIAQAIDDPDASVRLLAVAAAATLPATGAALRDRLRARLDDPCGEVRAEAAPRRGAEGLPRLLAMARSPSDDARQAAIARLPVGRVDALSELADSQSAEIRAAAIDRLVEVGATERLHADRLAEDLRSEHAPVRRAAAAALARLDDSSAPAALAEALDDVSRAVRSEAQRALAALGADGVRAAAPQCRGDRIWTAEAALGAVAMAGGPDAHRLLRQCFAERVHEAWSTSLATLHCPVAGDLETRFLKAALDDAQARARALAFRTLEHIEDPAVVRSVVQALAREGPRARADALEVLSNLGDRVTAGRLALLLEGGPLEEKLAAIGDAIQAPSGLDEVLEQARSSDDPWLRLAAGRYGDPGGPREDGARSGAEPAALVAGDPEEIMERLLALQRVPLFAHLSLSQLDEVNRLLSPVEFLAGEVIVREGEPGRDLYILVEGEVAIYKAFRTPAEVRLSVMQPGAYFGEIAILDNEPRSATIVATENSRLLALASARFKELLLQAPEISFEVFPVLTERLRTAEARITDLKSGE